MVTKRRQLSLSTLLSQWGRHEGLGRLAQMSSEKQVHPELTRAINGLRSRDPVKRFAAGIDITLLWRFPLLGLLFAAHPTKDVFEVAIDSSGAGLLRTWDGRLFSTLVQELTPEATCFIRGLKQRDVVRTPLLAAATSLDGPFIVLDGTHRVFAWLGHPRWREPLRLGVVLVQSLKPWKLEASSK